MKVVPFDVVEIAGRFVIARCCAVKRGKRVQKLLKYLRKDKRAGGGLSFGTGNRCEVLAKGASYARKGDATKRLNSLSA